MKKINYRSSIKKDNNYSVLVTIADKKYIRQAKQLFSSAYWNAGWCGDYLLLAHEIPEYDLKWFREKGIKIYKCKPLWHQKEYCGLSTSSLDRIYLFKLYFKKWKNIVYIDGDIIIKSSLENLTTIKGLGAVMDEDFALGNNFKSDKQFLLEKKYNLKKPGFNAGVLTLNTKIITVNSFNILNKKIITQKYLLQNGDQALLNLHFYKKWEKLPRQYNVLINNIKEKGKLDEKTTKAVVLHFANKPKPWNEGNRFHKEWQNNLLLAEKINLSEPRQSIKTLNHSELKIQNEYSRITLFLARVRNRMRKYDDYFKEIIRQLLYRIGRLIKKVSPKLYYKIGGKN